MTRGRLPAGPATDGLAAFPRRSVTKGQMQEAALLRVLVGVARHELGWRLKHLLEKLPNTPWHQPQAAQPP